MHEPAYIPASDSFDTPSGVHTITSHPVYPQPQPLLEDLPPEERPANPFLLILCFLIPVIGLIIGFALCKSRPKASTSCLNTSLASFGLGVVVGFLIRLSSS
jgi:hypothetical protein